MLESISACFKRGFLADKSISTIAILRQSETRILDFTRRAQYAGKDGFYGFHLLSTRIVPADLTDLPLGVKVWNTKSVTEILALQSKFVRVRFGRCKRSITMVVENAISDLVGPAPVHIL